MKREHSQPHNFESNTSQGKKFDENGYNNMRGNECLKASIWNKPEDDPRYVLRIGTSKIRSHSEDLNIKTYQDEEKDKEQFAMYCKEVERRYRRSKIKDFKFPKKKVRKTHIQSRNQTEKYTKLADLFGRVKGQGSTENLSSILTSSIDSKKRLTERSYSRRNFNSTSRRGIKNTKTTTLKSFENVKNLYMKYSMSSGSLNKMKTYENPLFKENKIKRHRKFMVERKQINLQSKSRDNSLKRLQALSKAKPITKTKTITLPEFKMGSRNLIACNNKSQILKTSQNLNRSKSGLTVLMKKRIRLTHIGDYSQNTSSHKSINQSGTSKLYHKKRVKPAKDRSAKLIQTVGQKHFSNLNKATPEFYKKTLTSSFHPLYSQKLTNQIRHLTEKSISKFGK
jgi:hypothetical protein